MNHELPDQSLIGHRVTVIDALGRRHEGTMQSRTHYEVVLNDGNVAYDGGSPVIIPNPASISKSPQRW